mmetsp:Transcript_187/g.361  ORF Transcript_187/g.361 Transcript_187/m.361 type:complete len:100 (-) Transcript_187:200-499(-)
MAENAALTAPVTSDSGTPSWPCARMVTNVPSNGCMRSTLATVKPLQRQVIDSQNPPHPVCDVLGGQRGARDVGDVLVEPDWRRGSLADKLLPPRGPSHL